MISGHLNNYLEKLRNQTIDRQTAKEISTEETSDPIIFETTPDVSVVILTHQGEKYISRAIDGVLAQQCSFRYELILAENGSTDRTRDICFEYQKKHPDKIRVIYNDENIGGPGNFFTSIGHSRGKYIGILCDDDYYHDTEHLQMLHSALESDQELCACTTATRVIEHFPEEKVSEWLMRPSKGAGIYTYEDILVERNFLHSSSTLLRNDFLSLPLWIEKCRLSDFAWFSFLIAGKKVRFIDRPTSTRHITHEGIWSSLDSERQFIEAVNSISVVRAYLPEEFHPALDDKLLSLMNQWNAEKWLTHSYVTQILSKGVNEVIAFGAGEIGSAFIRTAAKLGLNVIAIVDSSPHLHGAHIDQVPIISLRSAASYDCETYAITSIAFCEEIKKSIEQAYNNDKTNLTIFQMQNSDLL